MQRSSLVYERVTTSHKRYTKGVSNMSKMISKKGKGLDLETEPPLPPNLVEFPPGGGLTRILSRFVFVSLAQRNQVETARLNPALRKCVMIAKRG